MSAIFYYETKGSIVEHTTDAPVFAVKGFERGFYPIYTSASAETLNRGKYSPEVLQSAKEASVFGWHTPAAQAAREYVEAQERAQVRA